MNALVLLYTYRDSIYDQVIDHFDKKNQKNVTSKSSKINFDNFGQCLTSKNLRKGCRCN